MDRKRSIAVGTIIVAVALGAGHFVQSRATAEPEPEQAVAEAPAPTAMPQPMQASATPALPVATDLELVSAVAPPDDALSGDAIPDDPLADAPAQPSAAPMPMADPVQTADASQTTDCPLHLDLVPQDGAMIGVTLVAPCHADERLTLSHGGLVVSDQTTMTGSLFTALPAMDAAGEITVTFADGQVETAAMPMPELDGIQRYAVQWAGDDRFALNAFRDGAAYGEPGHMTAQPLAMLDVMDDVGAVVIALGNPDTTLPLLAEVYTLPTDAPVDLTIEAEVTALTCGRELLGETLDSRNGAVTVQDLSLAMPECDALGDFIVLNNPRPDLKLASAD